MIVITGASDGLGLQLAKLYKESGKKVVNISRTESKFADLNILHNLREGIEIISAAKKVCEIDEPIDAIINCVGVYTGEKLGFITEEEIKRAMSSNVKSHILIVSELYERLVADKSDIVNVSSTVGTKGRGGEPVYASTKWAVRGFTKSLQEDFKDLPNRVISFCPGGYKTQFFKKGTGVDNTGDGSEWMRAEDLAKFMKQILDLPKNMEVSEVVINRKAAK